MAYQKVTDVEGALDQEPATSITQIDESESAAVSRNRVLKIVGAVALVATVATAGVVR